MHKVCSIPVAQALQRHSGGWKASPPPTAEPDRKPPPCQRDAAPERVVSDGPIPAQASDRPH